MTNFASIPTEYKGINFRSRLEARWACMFDLFQWEWEYEPVDLNGWIPDFKIKGNKDIYVEIKYFPLYSDFPEFDDRWIKQMKKIERANPDLPVLLLTNNPVDNESNVTTGCFGFLFEERNGKYFNKVEPSLTECTIAWASNPFLVEAYPDTYKPSYTVKGNTSVYFEGINKEMLTRYWNEAGNRTQWKGMK